ncbi:MAG: hypothetical protein NTW08_05220 [Gammaproteobacteria bacterium]|nr:hypothetical protein [Gammaproteobacteria bacterium]
MKILGIIWIFLFGLSNIAHTKAENIPQAPLFDNLGTYHHLVSTHNALAQRFFDQGFILYYGFEWGESIRSFREATRLDPHCGMCYWGLALALGSKINAPVSGHEYPEAKAAIEKALSLKAYETPVESAYIQALAIRFQHKPKKTIPSASAFNCHFSNTLFDSSSKKEMSAYANAMRQLTTHYPNDNDAKALYVFTLFQANEWHFWSIDGKPKPTTPRAINALKSVLKSDPNHIGANHYYIHMIESSPHPEYALDSANRLRTLIPGSEHLIHMPTHIYFLTGRHHEGSESNSQAITTFKQYNKSCHAQGFEPEINYLYFHNFDFLRTTATMEGRRQLALSTAHDMLKAPFPTWLKHDPSLQWFIPIPYYVEARFALWDAILNEPKPKAKYQYALGMWHYARGMAYINQDNIKSSKMELSKLNKIIQQGPGNNTLEQEGISVLKLANEILNATMSDHEGNEKSVFTHLNTAEKIQHDMRYHEPPDWYFPIKEALADAYLKWHHPEKAQAMYEKTLLQYPKNGWVLYGLAKSLRALNKEQEATRIEEEFKLAWKYADIPTPILLLPFKNSLRDTSK